MIQNLHPKKMMQSLRNDIITSAASPARRKGERRHPAASSVYEPTTGLFMAKRLTTEEFISRARQKHGNKYIYDKCEYVNAKTKIVITCKEHGDFTQSPSDHLQGKGCKRCADISGWDKRKTTTSEFVLKASAIHSNKYTYGKTEYKQCHLKVCITCRKHGDFYQSPSSHLRGFGCPSCKFEVNAERCRMTKSEFISRSKGLHGDSYDYSMVEYKNNNTKVAILCKEHGLFMMSPGNHLAGKGCSGCAKHGFDYKREGFVYFLMGDGVIKVGITNDIKQRIARLSRRTPFDFSLIAKIKTTGEEAAAIEKYYHNKYESAGLYGFDGATEWLKYSTELMNEIMNEDTPV